LSAKWTNFAFELLFPAERSFLVGVIFKFLLDDARSYGTMSTVLITAKSLPIRHSNSDVATRLAAVDWDFADATSRRSIHSFHSYPARFIPEIPRNFLDVIKPPIDSLVFDPFCGCGTTLVEAQYAGYSSLGIDLNPIACLVSRIKTTTLPSGFLEQARLCVMRAKASDPQPLPKIPNLFHWFRRDVCQSLASLRAAIHTVDNSDIKQALEGVFSSIIVKVSNQESDTRYAAVAKEINGEHVFTEFMRAAQSLAHMLTSQLPIMRRPTARVINHNIFEIAPSDIPGEVGLVVTSPPYPNAYEYWLYHKYRMWWLGYDPLLVKHHEIGARAHFFSKKRKKKEDFQIQMSHVFALLREVMQKGAYCCFVAGDSKIHGRVVDNAKALSDAAALYEFKLVFRSERSINQNRKSFNLHYARIKREHVLVWER
jgi:hypothetical protein